MNIPTKKTHISQYFLIVRKYVVCGWREGGRGKGEGGRGKGGGREGEGNVSAAGAVRTDGQAKI